MIDCTRRRHRSNDESRISQAVQNLLVSQRPPTARIALYNNLLAAPDAYSTSPCRYNCSKCNQIPQSSLSPANRRFRRSGSGLSFLLFQQRLPQIAFFILVLFVKLGGTIPPQLNVMTSEVRVRAGETAVLTCVVDYLGAHQLTWHRGQNLVLAVDEKLLYSDRRMAVGRPSIRTWELRIQNVTRRDAGDYICVINSRDLPSGKISLVVEEPARIVSAPQPIVTVDEFETFKLICNASGYPRPRVEWFRLSDQDELKISENYGEILLFINVTRDCFGRYRCRASNGVGDPEHRDTEVSVIARPVVVVDPENVGRERGGKVTVDCSISGHPISWAGWFLRGELLTNGGSPPSPPPLRRSALSAPGLASAKQAASNRHRIEWLGRASPYRAVLRLTIDPLLDDSDFGSYTCAATDGRSFTSNASFYLWEKTPMPTPSAIDTGLADNNKADSSEGGMTSTIGWRPSIIIDNRAPTEASDGEYIVGATSTPFDPELPPKITDEGVVPGGSDPYQPSKVDAESRSAAANGRQRNSASPAMRQDFQQQCLITGVVLVCAAVFHSWLKLTPANDYNNDSSSTSLITIRSSHSPSSCSSSSSSSSSTLSILSSSSPSSTTFSRGFVRRGRRRTTPAIICV